MTTTQTVPDLIATAQSTAKTHEDTILELRELVDAQTASDAQLEEYRAATQALQLLVVDTFTLFEARMQSHFRRGPFSRKLKAALLEAGQGERAQNIHSFYLVVNVLKHGTGASYRELLNIDSPLFIMCKADSSASQEEDAPSPLIDLTVPGFFDGLTRALSDAHSFLENR